MVFITDLYINMNLYDKIEAKVECESYTTIYCVTPKEYIHDGLCYEDQANVTCKEMCGLT